MLRIDDLDRATRHCLLEQLVRTRGVVVDDIDGVIDAMDRFRQASDLADQLILARVGLRRRRATGLSPANGRA